MRDQGWKSLGYPVRTQDSFRPDCSQIQSYIINTLSNGELEMTSRLAWRKFQYGSLSRVFAYYRPCPQIWSEPTRGTRNSLWLFIGTTELNSRWKKKIDKNIKSVKKDFRLINLNCLSTQLLSDKSKWKFNENPQHLQLTTKIIRTCDFTFPLSLMHFVFPIKFRIHFISFPQAMTVSTKRNWKHYLCKICGPNK